MGFDDAARRLWARTGDPKRHTVPIITLGEYRYVVTVASVRPRYGGDILDPDLWRLICERPDWTFGPFPEGISIELIGLDLEVVEALEMAIRGQLSEELMAIKPVDRRDVPREFDGGAFYGSVFSDGSLLGEITLPRASRSSIEGIEVAL